jgi:hypothetical protein
VKQHRKGFTGLAKDTEKKACSRFFTKKSFVCFESLCESRLGLVAGIRFSLQLLYCEHVQMQS